MLIMKAPQAWIKASFLIGLIAVLTACNGGGSSNPEPPAPDTTPNAFTFENMIDVEPGSTRTSNTVTISGIDSDSPTPISITGGQYAIGSNAPTSAAGTITNGQTVTISLTASESTLTPVTATLNIGGVTGTFTVTTIADTTPAVFSFTAVADVEPGSVQTSNTITVAGIDIAVPISITGGEYAIGEGEYTAEAGTVEADQVVTVRVTADEGTDETVDAVLSIGGVEATYSVTTFADTEAPTAEILFPPPVSMTEGTTLLVRGKATDDFNSVETVQIRLNEGTAQDVVFTENDDGSASWQVEVNLDAGENTITVSTEDSAGNPDSAAAQVSVRQDVTLGSFPDAENPFATPGALVVDRLDGRNRLLVAKTGSGRSIDSVDLTTGARSLFKDYSGSGFTAPQDLIISESTNQLLVRDDAQMIATIDLSDPSQFSVYTFAGIGDGFVFTFDDSSEPATLMAANQNNGNLVRVSSDFTATEIFSDSSNAAQGQAMARTHGIVFDKSNERYLLSSPLDYTIYAVDSNSGLRSIFSQIGDENGVDFGSEIDMYLNNLTIDSAGNRALVTEMTSGRIFAVDLTTGERSILSSQTPTNSFNPMDWPWDVAVNSPESYIFVSDRNDESIFAVDIVTGHRVYFTKN